MHSSIIEVKKKKNSNKKAYGNRMIKFGNRDLGNRFGKTENLRGIRNKSKRKVGQKGSKRNRE